MVVLVGASSAGKSTFSERNFDPTEVVSSDRCRAMVSGDENSRDADADTFELVHHIAGIRLRRGLLTVVDATSLHPNHRIELVRIAKRSYCRAVAIVLDPPLQTLLERHEARPDRPFEEEVVRAQHARLKRGLKRIDAEGFAAVHRLESVEAIDGVRIDRMRLPNDLRHLDGPFDLIGDVHGCCSELRTLLHRLGWELDGEGARHPDGRTAVFLGDLVDRGPDAVGALRLAMRMVEDGVALCLPGNHEARFRRWLAGKNVKPTHGLDATIAEFEALGDPDFEDRVRDFIDGMVDHYRLDGGSLVVAHAGLLEKLQGREGRRVGAFCLWGETTGETDAYGLPVRLDWAAEYTGAAAVVYGHTPVLDARWVNDTICLDTGCVFGGKLTALRWPERELVQVAAEQVWYEPIKPLT